MDHEKLARMQNAVRIAYTLLPPSNAVPDPAARATPKTAKLPSPRLAEPTTPIVSHGKGTPRRKVKKVHKSSGTDDKKLQTTLKKMNVQPITQIEEVNMFKSDGNVIHFSAPKVHASVPSNTFALYGNGEDKELTELVPGILNQLGPDSLASLRKLAESYQSLQKGGEGEEGGKKAGGEDDDEEIPDLVEGEEFGGKGDVE
ncbi:Nascent polypeptide-associated complex subunit beta [Friedmanniomyces simplex]|uniref:Nascent polypeptide-associated complex subunit beta n=1 Tax=Friedmanniomyces simplex TaxID=329884 RepID=A0A4U0VQQ2_9PEZI|nr:Nascent polypeptide-associated complex subunit beta [Friedmanniomyces simplex]